MDWNPIRIRKFIQKFGNPANLTGYMFINKEDNSYKISIKTFIPDINDRILKLNITFQENKNKNNIFYFPNLPSEISELINSLIKQNQLILQIYMYFPLDYPYRSPKYELVGLKETIKCNKNTHNLIGKFIKYKLKIHNKLNKSYWCMAISIEKDILDLLVKINYFEDLITYS